MSLNSRLEISEKEEEEGDMMTGIEWRTVTARDTSRIGTAIFSPRQTSPEAYHGVLRDQPSGDQKKSLTADCGSYAKKSLTADC